MSKRRRRPMPTMGRGATPVAYAPTGTTAQNSAVAEHLMGIPSPPPPATDRLELVPTGRTPSSDGKPTAAPDRGDALDSLVARSHLPARPGKRINTVLRQVDARSLGRPGRLPPLSTAPTPAPSSRRPTDRVRHASTLGRTYSTAVLRAAVLNRAAVRERPVVGSLQIQAMLVTAAARYGVDPSLALAVAYRESGFHQHRVSSANAIGVMQVVPSSGAWASTVVGRRLDLLDVEDNIVAGMVLLSCLLAVAPEPVAVAGYYQGLSSVHRHGVLPDTRRYVSAVQTLKSRFH